MHIILLIPWWHEWHRTIIFSICDSLWFLDDSVLRSLSAGMQYIIKQAVLTNAAWHFMYSRIREAQKRIQKREEQRKKDLAYAYMQNESPTIK